MANFMRTLLTIEKELTLEERNLLCVAYKNVTTNLRNGWKKILAIERTAKVQTRQQALIHHERTQIEAEITRACEDMIHAVDKTLLPSANSSETQVFYLKLYVDKRSAPCLYSDLLYFIGEQITNDISQKLLRHLCSAMNLAQQLWKPMPVLTKSPLHPYQQRTPLDSAFL